MPWKIFIHRVVVAGLLAMVLSLGLFPGPAMSGEGVLEMAYPAGARPFYWEEAGKPRGIFVDFMDEILVRRLGIPVHHKGCPWARCQEMVKDGEKDGFFTIPNPARRKYTVISRLPLFKTNFHAYIASNNPNTEIVKKSATLDKLLSYRHLTHVYLRGSGWHLIKLKDYSNKIETKSLDEIWQLLLKGRADVYLQQDVLGTYRRHYDENMPEIVEVATPFDTTGWHLCISKRSPFAGRMKDVNALLEQMAADGSLEELRQTIFARYR